MKMIKKIYIVRVAILIIPVLGWFYYDYFFLSSNDLPSQNKSPLASEYLNMAPEVKFVGDEACSACHLEIFKSFKRTGMGMSFYKPSTGNVIENFKSNNRVYDKKSNFQYEMIREKGEFYQREYRVDDAGNQIHELKRKIDWIIGSGRQARTYMTTIGGLMYEMPVTWYSEKGKWDLSPGYHSRNQRFSRPIVAECMNCHNSYTDHVENSENKFRNVPSGIGCERCHGPGELHVESRFGWKINTTMSGAKDPTIVNPARLPLREQMDVCLQCHLLGEKAVFKEGMKSDSFRPGMRLTDLKSIYISDDISPNNFDIASHGERTSLSACYIKSNGALTCIVCHDPHNPVKSLGRVHFNNKCLQCHEIGNLSREPEGVEHQVDANCISCHMKQGDASDVLHVNFTDHWIRKRLSVDEPQKEEGRVITLKDFMGETDSSADIRLGIAYVKYFEEKHPEQEYLVRAIELLEEGLKSNREHISGLYNLGKAHLSLKNPRKAAQALERAIMMNPVEIKTYFALGISYEKLGEKDKAMNAYLKSLEIYSEDALVLTNLGNLEQGAGNSETAIDYYIRAIKSEPSYPGSYVNLGRLYLVDYNNPARGKEYIQEALRLDPDYIPALSHLGSILVAEGDDEGAIKLFDRILEINPSYISAYGNLASVFAKRGELAIAREYLLTLLELAPNNKNARKMLARIETTIKKFN
ncbi:tetratricopeptide repeat protein [Candidatus Marinimicrobia bacterium MT.SAG.4]|nr:tetratricopeptide repeat protein [Candidatus Marinimicrobia bacterium MT.SAG.4]